MEGGGSMPAKSLMWLGALTLLSPLADAQVTFQFDYSDPSAELWTPESRAALDTAAANLSSYLPLYTANIRIAVLGTNANNGTLAGAGSYYYNPVPGFGNMGIIGSKILAEDTSSLSINGRVTANFFHNWSFDDTVTGSQFDFISVMMHEIGHAMGFASLVGSNGESDLGFDGSFSPFDQFLVNSSGQALVYQGTFNTGPEWEAASVGGTGNGIFFNGPNAVAVYGGLIPIYSPTTWAEGSSGSHLDTGVFTGTDRQLMNHAITRGPGEREFSELEIAMFRDLGYTHFGVVPEPSTGVLVAVSAGFFLRRRRPTGSASLPARLAS